jgi:hypothetical protein
VRGDAGLTLRLLLRGAGFAGLVTALGGGLVVAGVLRPWYAVVAEVSMLGSDSSRTVASLPGFPGTVGGWLAGSLGLVVVALGVLIAFDRSPVRGRLLALVAGVVAAGVAVLAVLSVPVVAEIAAETTEELLGVGRRLPVGVDLELHARAASGPWWVLFGAATAILGAAGAREH